MNVTFKFEPKQGVVTPLGDRGFIDLCGHQISGNMYYVKTSHGGEWFDEKDLLLPSEY